MKFTSIFFTASPLYLRGYRKDTISREENKNKIVFLSRDTVYLLDTAINLYKNSTSASFPGILRIETQANSVQKICSILLAISSICLHATEIGNIDFSTPVADCHRFTISC